MALIQCKECKAQVSELAEKCTQCGAPIAKPMGLFKKYVVIPVLGVIGLSIVMGIVSKRYGIEAAPPVQKTAQEIAGEKAESERRVMAETILQTILSNLRNPDSVVWESVRANEHASVVCVEYRAQNGFGGMNRSLAVFKDGKMSQAASAWNSNCTKQMYDLKGEALKLLEVAKR